MKGDKTMANLLDKIKTNRELVGQIKNKIEKGQPNHSQYKASINALELNNEILEELVKTIEGEATPGEAIGRVYAMLQTLFVSIDALYSINTLITNYKNYLNINQNRQLRELKYIRNDVVGHPVSRIYENEEVGFCLLKMKDVSKKSFVYHIYLDDTIKKREIKIPSLIDSFYEEANKFLSRLVEYKTFDASKICDGLKKVYIKLSADVDANEIRNDMLKLRSLYFSTNPQQTRNDVRFMWRFELFNTIRKNLDPKDKEINEILNYAAGYQLEKLYQTLLVGGQVDKSPLINNKLKEPKGIAQFAKLISTSPILQSAATHLHDMTHPLFAASVTKLLAACTKDYPYALKYLTLFKKFYDAQDEDMIYSLGVVLTDRRK